MLVNGLSTTVIIAFGAAILGTVLGTIIALMRLSDWNPIRRIYPLRIISTLFVDIIRGTPVVVQLMIMYYIILASTNISREMIALLSFGINSAAYVSEMVRSGILAVEKGQTEAGRSLGLSRLQTLFLIVLPQSIQIILPNLFNEFIMLLKETSVVGFIGLMDLTKAGDFIRSRTYSAFFPLMTVAIIYFLLITILTRIFSLGEKRIRARS
ncbi:MAG: amino acid ABC transporter permease [Clostridiales bacterium]|nr:amino acid ABC transporter permease [Clostridiales bacterium]